MTANNAIRLTVNGKTIEVAAEARTSLADLLRGDLRLTGTHLGCEQGACGACTVLIDGVPARSCIGSVVALNGADIKTIEGMNDDPVMEDLRKAFMHYHGLQCGFCTPGMLITARDLVIRMPEADKDQIRLVMSGNLCRCTGYVGIVNAIHSVIQERGGNASGVPQALSIGPAGGSHISPNDVPAKQAAEGLQSQDISARDEVYSFAGLTAKRVDGETPLEPTVHHSFTLNFPLKQVAERFRDVPFMITCIPGAHLKTARESGVFEVTLKASMGPISAEFAGVAEPEWEQDVTRGTVHGRGKDKRSATSARGEMVYELSEIDDGNTQINVHIGYALSGALGQFARGAIVKQFVALIVDQFAANFERKMQCDTCGEDSPESNELQMGSTIFQFLKVIIRRLFSRGER